ncbi:TolC family protein [Bacteroidales bacterium]|nr:TolC family protein [Bacteroidales bacterium]
MNKILLSLIVFFITHNVFSQKDSITILSYTQVIELALMQSPEALKNKTRKENSYWAWKSFKAGYLPKFSLESYLPSYSKSIRRWTNSDGSDRTAMQERITPIATLSGEQLIGATGGTIRLSSHLKPTINYSTNTENYELNAFDITYYQPILSFNRHKWDKKIQDLKLLEADKDYFLNMEQTAITATQFYFDLMIAQINLEISKLNLANNDTIFKIAKGRYDLGKIAENELLQIELQFLKSQQSLDQASMDIENYQLKLKNFIAIKDSKKIILLLPEVLLKTNINYQLALEKAKLNNPDVIQFERQRLEAQKNLKKAKTENGFNANLRLNYGYSGTADHMYELDNNIDPANTITAGLEIPILDWGRRKASINQAKANQRLTEYTVEQNIVNFEQEIFTQLNTFQIQKSQVDIAKKADIIGQKRYESAKNRYLIGNITITDMNIATTEKDAARISYIRALKNYWISYYSIRKLTLYDFILKQDIITQE